MSYVFRFEIKFRFSWSKNQRKHNKTHIEGFRASAHFLSSSAWMTATLFATWSQDASVAWLPTAAEKFATVHVPLTVTWLRRLLSYILSDPRREALTDEIVEAINILVRWFIGKSWLENFLCGVGKCLKTMNTSCLLRYADFVNWWLFIFSRSYFK